MDLSIIQLLSTYIFIVLLLIVVKVRGINREFEILLASLRMTIQLIIMGYVLVYVFKTTNTLFTVLILVIMETFAIFNIYSRVKENISLNLKKTIAISMIIGTVTSVIYFLFIVMGNDTWNNPQYSIPIFGMLVGNSMTGISLGVTRLISGMNNNKEKIETSLMLGAIPKVAVKEVIDNAFDSAVLPTINSMMGMGIVFLPGMMAGQILAGLTPTIAIKYQIAIMMGILGSVTMTVILFVNLGYKTFFNKDSQLKL